MLYLRLLGNVTAGWMMTAAASRAGARLAPSSDESRFLSAKLKSARYFADTRLAESGSLRGKFIAAGDALQGFDPEMHL